MPGFRWIARFGVGCPRQLGWRQDPVDAAIRSAARSRRSGLPKLSKFVPFRFATKMSEATAVDRAAPQCVLLKGPFAAVVGLRATIRPMRPPQRADSRLQGFRVLLSRRVPPEAISSRESSPSAIPSPIRRRLYASLRALGRPYRNGDGRCPCDSGDRGRRGGAGRSDLVPPGHPGNVRPEDFAVFVGPCFRRESYDLVKAFQKTGTPLACAATEPTTRGAAPWRRWESRCPRQPMSLSRRPASVLTKARARRYRPLRFRKAA